MTFWRLLTWTRSSGLRSSSKSVYATKADLLGPDLELSDGVQDPSTDRSGGAAAYEADSRHAEVIIEECEVRSCRAAKTPGSRGGWNRQGWNRDER